MLPDFISMVSGKDMVEATVRAAMGELGDFDARLDGEGGGFWGLGVLHSPEAGLYGGVDYSDDARRCLVRERIQAEPGDEVRPFERCNDLVGLSFFRFCSRGEMDSVMGDMGSSMRVVLR